MSEDTATAQNWTVVTVTVATDDGTESGTCRVSDGYSLERAVEVARDEALERYSDNICANLLAAHRIVTHIDTFPEPQIRETRITNTLPGTRPDEPGTSEVM